MQKQFDDSVMLQQLKWLRNTYPNVYVNMKRHVEMTREKIIIADLENALMNRTTCPHTVYKIPDKVRGAFACYLGKPCTGIETYFVVAPDLEYAAMYHLTELGYICEKRHLLFKYRVEDILCTFDGSLQPLIPPGIEDFEDNASADVITLLPKDNRWEDDPL